MKCESWIDQHDTGMKQRKSWVPCLCGEGDFFFLGKNLVNK